MPAAHALGDNQIEPCAEASPSAKQKMRVAAALQ
jgi:hypothetical protein